jgi:hypothetical protein
VKRIHGVALVLALVARMHVVLFVAGDSCLGIAAAAHPRDIETWSVRAIPRQGWPGLCWRRGFA